MLEKIIKIWYFKNTYWNESNDILYDIIYLCILGEKYGQTKLGQNCKFQTDHLLRDGGSNYYFFLQKITIISNKNTLGFVGLFVKLNSTCT